MLRELAVQNLAVIEDVRVELQPGFCAWTGETGAGKTLLLEALGLLLGERGSTDLIRTGAEELRITGLFDVSRPGLREAVLEILGDGNDETITLTRRLTPAGRSFAYVNEHPVAIATLRRLGKTLVDIHGQRESQSLLEPTYQLQLLDAFGDLEAARRAYETLAESVRGLRRRMSALDAERQQRQRELALLQFEREELDKAELKTGELAELARERERLTHAQGLESFAAGGAARLYDDEGAVFERLGRLARESHGWVALDPALEDASRRLESLKAETQDLAETLRTLAKGYAADPERREEVEDRLRSLRRLETKYGQTIDELIVYRDGLDAREEELKRHEDDRVVLETKLTAAFAELRAAGDELSRRRHQAAKKLAISAQKELSDLGMAEARLDASLESRPLGDDPLTAELPSAGFEQLELMLAANRGEPARPLRKVASGGELSRAMLALKTVLAGHDRVGTLVFDEIDANVGGRLGDVLGEKLTLLGKTHQVICVTHLPQVASYAPNQWSIHKLRRGSRTVTRIALLEEKERIVELASMLRGKSRSENTNKEAAAMLAAAKRCWL